MRQGEAERDLLVILDGLAEPLSRNTTLFSARTPNLDRLVRLGRLDRIDPQDGSPAHEVSSERGISRLMGLSSTESARLSRASLLSLLSSRDERLCWFFVATPAVFDRQDRLARFVNRPEQEDQFWRSVLDQVSENNPWRLLPVYGLRNRIDRMVVGFNRTLGQTGHPPRRGLKRGSNPDLPDFFPWIHEVMPKPDPEMPRSEDSINGLWLWGGGPSVVRSLLPERSDRLMVGATLLVQALAHIEGFTIAPLKRATGDIDTDLPEKMKHVEHGIRRGCRRILLHLEGFDMASHRRDPNGKREFLERVDHLVFSSLLRWLSEGSLTSLRITSDHQSSPVTGNHEPGPVPAISIDRESPRNGMDQNDRMTEWAVRDRPVIPLEQWMKWANHSPLGSDPRFSRRTPCLALS